MAAKVKVKFRWMSDFRVNCGASRDVSTLSNLKQTESISSPKATCQEIQYIRCNVTEVTNPLVPVHTEKPSMMSLLDYYKSDAWLVVLL